MPIYRPCPEMIINALICTAATTRINPTRTSKRAKSTEVKKTHRPPPVTLSATNAFLSTFHAKPRLSTRNAIGSFEIPAQRTNKTANATKPTQP